MSQPTVGLLHPGRMGAAVGHQLTEAGSRVVWCPAGRSAVTAERAATAGLEPVGGPAELAAVSDVLISLCPPAVAEDVAKAVAETDFDGIFVEANAISPARVRHIAGLFPAGRVIDGCVIGPPPSERTGARLYLSGAPKDVDAVARLCSGTAVEAIVIDGDVGQASALKMAYASYNKAVSALAAVSHALADTYGVGDHLMTEARRITRDRLANLDHLPSVAARAWRWAPEMEEAAATLAEADLPGELADGAAAVFRRWSADQDDFDIALPDVLAHLRTAGPANGTS
jgi:3-hydroxyisobutyrate dehydrogenase-like beta-hydroxyacid dehydrogenase